MNWEAWKPLATLIFTSTLKFVGGLLVAHGLATNGPGLEALGGAATTAAGALWSWWVQKGHVQAGDYLKKLTDTATQAAAIEVAKRIPVTSVPTVTVQAAKAAATVGEPAVMAKDAAKAIVGAVLIAAFALSFLLAGAPAFAQTGAAKSNITRPRLPIDPLGLNDQTIAGTTAAPAPTTVALPCTFQMLIHLTPENLLPTINSCIAGKLVADTQRALTSAQDFGTTGKGDADAVNCLTPALAIFQAGVQVPAVPEVAAALNADGTVKTPAVPAVPAQDPGPILLFQKYREFTLSGALTSCQAWFNAPINATIAAGIAGAGTAVAGAALLAPK